MPTGTGKTGIMATISTRRAQNQPVLIICPSIALVHQLIADFQTGFWDKIGAPRIWAPEQTLHLVPTRLNEVLTALAQGNDQRKVVFATVQTLQQIHAGPDYASLQGIFGTVLFDEGHREPAPAWAQAVRQLNVPTILFSATPFRNDLKVFEVDMDHVHFLSFQAATTGYLIRGVEIHEQNISGGADFFARTAIATRDRLIAEGRFLAHHKMIVRADHQDDIEALFAAFNRELGQRTDGVLALHINFSLDGPVGRQRRPDVPADLRTRPERFLIHQYMLTEGIDDPSCTMLALYEPFSTERQLVQQVGRLTRHDGVVGTPIPSSFVLARTGDRVPKMWNGFMAFDQTCIRNNGKPPIRIDAEIFDKLVNALPDVDYVFGQFRTRIDFDDVDLEDELRFPKSAVVFDIDPAIDLSAFQAEVTKGLIEEDRFERRVGQIAGGNCRFHLTLRLLPSPFLADALFEAPSLEVTIYAKHGDKLFFYDSAGLWIDNSDQWDRLQAGSLRSLLPERPDSFVTSLNMKNTDLGPLSVRSRSMSARSLSVSGVFMGEHLHVVTRATGRVGTNRRAVGFARNRVRESEGAQSTPLEYHQWTGSIADELRAQANGSSIFARFAAPTAIPQNTDPSNILIDVDEISDEFVDEDGNVAVFDLEHVCVDVVADPNGPAGFGHRFEIVVNNVSETVWIKWDPKRRKYWIRSDTFSLLKSRENPRISLAKRLNQRQPLRIVVGQTTTVYAYGDFYSIDLDLRRPGGAGSLVLSLVQGVAELAHVTSEKGDLKTPAQTWPSGSLFRLIDRSLRPAARNHPFGEPFAGLVCDDLGTEVADFIAIDDATAGAVASRAVFIIAKHQDGNPEVSASALYDVCGQAAKNLSYLKGDARDLPGSPQKWNNDWRLEGGRVARIRAGGPAAALRSMFARVRANPNAQRAVWMMLGGGMLSRNALEQALARTTPLPHVLQFVHLVLSVYASCQSIGAEFRIFAAE